MARYQELSQKALGIAFIAAPLMLSIGVVVYLLGIERSADNTSSWVEGMFMGMAFILFEPTYLELCRRLGADAPILAIICAVGVIGLGYGVVPASLRIMQFTLADAGFNQSVWTISVHTGFTPGFMWMAFGVLSSILLGIGFLRNGGISRLSALLLIVAPILLLTSQGGDETIADWKVNLAYPLSAILWLVAFTPIGWRYLRISRAVMQPP
jgi:hypothetical protein